MFLSTEDQRLSPDLFELLDLRIAVLQRSLGFSNGWSESAGGFFGGKNGLMGLLRAVYYRSLVRSILFLDVFTFWESCFEDILELVLTRFSELRCFCDVLLAVVPFSVSSYLAQKVDQRSLNLLTLFEANIDQLHFRDLYKSKTIFLNTFAKPFTPQTTL